MGGAARAEWWRGLVGRAIAARPATARGRRAPEPPPQPGRRARPAAPAGCRGAPQGAPRAQCRAGRRRLSRRRPLLCGGAWASARPGGDPGDPGAAVRGGEALGRQRRAEPPPQRGERAKGEQLHRALTAPHDVGDLAVAELAPEAEQDRLTLIVGKRGDGGPDLGGTIVALRLLLRTGQG